MKEIVRRLLIIVLACVVLYSGYQVYQTWADYKAAEDAYNDVANRFVSAVDRSEEYMDAEDGRDTTGSTGETTEQAEAASEIPISVDFDALLEANPHIVGWIYCPDTSINYPILQSENNYDHLYRLLDGSYSRSGSIFMDYRSDSTLQDYNAIIYGHNMGNGKMFAPLMNYRQQSYYDEHPVMYLLTPAGNYRLDILAGALVSSTSDYYAASHTEESFRTFLSNASRRSTFVSTVDISTVERTVLLSTCTNSSEDGRYILICSLVPITE